MLCLLQGTTQNGWISLLLCSLLRLISVLVCLLGPSLIISSKHEFLPFLFVFFLLLSPLALLGHLSDFKQAGRQAPILFISNCPPLPPPTSGRDIPVLHPSETQARFPPLRIFVSQIPALPTANVVSSSRVACLGHVLCNKTIFRPHPWALLMIDTYDRYLCPFWELIGNLSYLVYSLRLALGRNYIIIIYMPHFWTLVE
jgi:hypothetical protein